MFLLYSLHGCVFKVNGIYQKALVNCFGKNAPSRAPKYTSDEIFLLKKLCLLAENKASVIAEPVYASKFALIKRLCNCELFSNGNK